jgi:hypothetical protein
MVRLAVAAALGAAVALAPAPARAGHAGAADCPHTHLDPAISSCNKGVAGKKKCGDDKAGTCQQVNTDFFGDPIPSCLCLTPEDEAAPQVIIRMERATRLALGFPAVLSTLGSVGMAGAACGQLRSAVLDIMADQSSLANLPLRVYHPKLLERLDYTIVNLPTTAQVTLDNSVSCAAAGVTLPTVPVSSLLSGLAQSKQQIIDSRPRLIE